MTGFVFNSPLVIFLVIIVCIPPKSEEFTAGGGGNIPGRKRSEFMVRFGSLSTEKLDLRLWHFCLMYVLHLFYIDVFYGLHIGRFSFSFFYCSARKTGAHWTGANLFSLFQACSESAPKFFKLAEQDWKEPRRLYYKSGLRVAPVRTPAWNRPGHELVTQTLYDVLLNLYIYKCRPGYFMPGWREAWLSSFYIDEVKLKRKKVVQLKFPEKQQWSS